VSERASVRRRPPRRRVGRLLLPLVLALVTFVLGLALGQALDDNPPPGGEQTLVRTLTPLPLTSSVPTTTGAGTTSSP
jgi:hypothetical protein